MDQKSELHPSIKKFKKFLNDNPHLINEVRKETTTFQQLFEDWYLFGDDDSHWDVYNEKDSDEKKKGEKKLIIMTKIKLLNF